MIENIKRHTKWTLYYLAKAANAVKKGEDPTIWIAQAMKSGADLGKDYYLNYMTDAEKNIDFEQIYQDAVAEAQEELQKD